MARKEHPQNTVVIILMILVDGETEDRVSQSALIKMGLDHPIGQFPFASTINIIEVIVIMRLLWINFVEVAGN